MYNIHQVLKICKGDELKSEEAEISAGYIEWSILFGSIYMQIFGEF